MSSHFFDFYYEITDKYTPSCSLIWTIILSNCSFTSIDDLFSGPKLSRSYLEAGDGGRLGVARTGTFKDCCFIGQGLCVHGFDTSG